jgi:hypothetical protein
VSGKSPQRELVESAGDPWIKLTIRDDDTVSVQAAGVEEQNVIPILARIVKAYATAELP